MAPPEDNELVVEVPGARLLERRRKLTTWLFLAAAAAAAIVGIRFPEARDHVVSPGKLASVHGTLEQNCAACHTSAHQTTEQLMQAIVAGDRGTADQVLCLECHRYGEAGLQVHGVATAELEAMAGLAAGSDGVASKRLQSPACATCHKEHGGPDAMLSKVTDQRCFDCHGREMGDFVDGHPEFTHYPANRRTRIFFDHATHLQKHFRAETVAGAPTTCTDCHAPDAHGQTMTTVGFERGCAACHDDETRNASLTVLSVPGVDGEALGIGPWPADADGGLTAFMKLLLSADDSVDAAMTAVSGKDWYDLADESAEVQAQVATVAKGIGALYADLDAGGQRELAARLQVVFPNQSEARLRELFFGLPPDGIRDAHEDWFSEVATADKEQAAADKENAPVELADDASGGGILGGDDEDILGGGGDILGGGDDGGILGGDDAGSILGGDEEDILGGGADILGAGDDAGSILGGDDDGGGILGSGGDILGAGDGDEDGGGILSGGGDILGGDDGGLAEAAPEAEPERERVGGEEWAAFGGWYRNYFQFKYRPTGHGDRLLAGWLEAVVHSDAKPRAAAVFKVLAEATAPGSCSKCHSIDRPGTELATVNWHAKNVAPTSRHFTRFSHAVHLTLNDPESCAACHKLDAEADYAGAFAQHDPSVFTSNFTPISKQQCVGCHRKDAASTACVTCHHYHTGPKPGFSSAGASKE